MHRIGSAILLLAVVMALNGCQSMINKTQADSSHASHPSPPFAGSHTPAMAPVAGGADLQQHLATCLFEAEQLARLNAVKYREPVNDLYRNIRAAKYYATLAARMNTGSTDTLTPMYQFRVNDACNTVSQLLLGELKQGSTGPEGNR
ncbi:hypothetical protein [Enterobacter ludwigii]|uniref:hypothetical protein n=1 Tax=Enterobacter ludwigii TaxID=299767 RepID=UPI00069AE671|nr:hypothetical protein [Enterobacter ludwigii]